jgi:hypothetical protein
MSTINHPSAGVLVNQNIKFPPAVFREHLIVPHHSNRPIDSSTVTYNGELNCTFLKVQLQPFSQVTTQQTIRIVLLLQQSKS